MRQDLKNYRLSCDSCKNGLVCLFETQRLLKQRTRDCAAELSVEVYAEDLTMVHLWMHHDHQATTSRKHHLAPSRRVRAAAEDLPGHRANTATLIHQGKHGIGRRLPVYY